MVSSQRKEGKKKVSLHESHVCFDCPQKISASRKEPRQKDIQSQHKTTTSFSGKELRVNHSLLIRPWICTELVFAMWLCAHELCRFVRNHLSRWVVLFRDCLFLCYFILQTAFMDDGQRMGFGVKDPVFQGEEVIIREKQVKISEQTRKTVAF